MNKQEMTVAKWLLKWCGKCDKLFNAGDDRMVDAIAELDRLAYAWEASHE